MNGSDSPPVPFPSLQEDVPSIEVLEHELAWMKETLSQLGSPVVLCHNDLLCKNIIYNQTQGWWQQLHTPGEGSVPHPPPRGLAAPSPAPAFASAGHVRFIDYEYTGYNYQAFDIGNHFNEFAGELGPSLCTKGPSWIAAAASGVSLSLGMEEAVACPVPWWETGQLLECNACTSPALTLAKAEWVPQITRFPPAVPP